MPATWGSVGVPWYVLIIVEISLGCKISKTTGDWCLEPHEWGQFLVIYYIYLLYCYFTIIHIYQKKESVNDFVTILIWAALRSLIRHVKRPEGREQPPGFLPECIDEVYKANRIIWTFLRETRKWIYLTETCYHTYYIHVMKK